MGDCDSAHFDSVYPHSFVGTTQVHNEGPDFHMLSISSVICWKAVAVFAVRSSVSVGHSARILLHMSGGIMSVEFGGQAVDLLLLVGCFIQVFMGF
jgi:hypothetical protein